MLLHKLELDNVKCFAKGTTVDFTVDKKKDEPPHRWVVVYGDNGLGKSTLLRAIAVALTGEPALNYLLPTAEGWVRGTNKTARIGVRFSRNDSGRGEGDVISGQRKRPIDVSWTLVGRRSTSLDGRKTPPGAIRLDDTEDAGLFQTYVASDEERRGWLLCGYGPHRRLTGASSDIAEKIPAHGRASRLITLFHEKAALTSAERWLIELDHEARKTSDKGRLEAVRTMLDDGLLHDGVTLGEIETDRVFFRTPFSGRVPMSDLSDGYRTSLALALDLLRHISICFDVTRLLRKDDGDKRLVDAEGIVLIDEIDSHLHPKWQRTIGDWLHRTFPKLQFIVATHSPLIPERVSQSDGMVVRLVQRTQGKGEVVGVECERATGRALTADQNLTGPNFGLTSTRDLMTDRLLDEIARLRHLVRKGSASPSEKTELKQLQLDFERSAPPAVLVERRLSA
jgi:hypothetical protein